MSGEKIDTLLVQTEFPTQDSWLVNVPFYPDLDIILICGLTRSDVLSNQGEEIGTHHDLCIGVEIVMRLSSAENLVDVDVHASIVAPIISQ